MDIFAGFSNAGYVYNCGLSPKYIVAVDSSEYLYDRYKEVESKITTDTTLITNPTIDHNIIDKYTDRGLILIYNPIQKSSDFITSVLPVMYSYRTENHRKSMRIMTRKFDTGIMNAGCVVNTSVLAAVYLNYSPIYVLGVDFCYKGNQMQAPRYVFDNQSNDSFRVDFDEIITNRPLILENNKLTTEEMKAYLINFYYVWRLTTSRIINLSDYTLLDDELVPTVSIDQLNEHFEKINSGYQYPNDEEIAKAVDNCFLKHNLKVIVHDDGSFSLEEDKKTEVKPSFDTAFHGAE
jgi:hypothetical protein